MYKSNDVPRLLPLGLKLKIMTSGALFWIGLIFFLFGCTFAYFFSNVMDFKSISFDPDQKAYGVVREKSFSNCSENKRSILRYDYDFTTNSGVKQTGNSYSSDFVEIGETVSVEYETKKPENSRIIGMRNAPFSVWLGLVLVIFPGIGLVFLLISFSSGRKKLHLTTNGIITKGKVVLKEATNTVINNRVLYRITFEFKSRNGHTIQAKCTTTEPEKVLDEAEELLLYDERQPEKAILIDTINKAAKEYLLGQ
jgi:hypothetical protein